MTRCPARRHITACSDRGGDRPERTIRGGDRPERTIRGGDRPERTIERRPRMRSHAIHANTWTRRAAILAVSSLLLGLAACGSHSSTSGSACSSGSSGTGPLTFAVFNPFSGPDASFGPEQLAGCIPAAAAINAVGGILAHKKIVCKTADSRGDPGDAVAAA